MPSPPVPRRQFNVTLPADLVDEVRAEAARRLIHTNALVAEIFSGWLDRHGGTVELIDGVDGLWPNGAWPNGPFQGAGQR